MSIIIDKNTKIVSSIPQMQGLDKPLFIIDDPVPIEIKNLAFSLIKFGRFLEKVSLPTNLYKDCWKWTSSLDSEGYGRIKIHGLVLKAHRLSYEIFRTKIPVGYVIDHLCRNIDCVNPFHLEVVTNHENLIRKYKRQTHCKRGHPLSGENLMPRKDGHRACRKCTYERNRSYR